MNIKNELDNIFTNKEHSSIVVIEKSLIGTVDIEEISNSLEYKYIYIDGVTINDKQSLLVVIAAALKFPDYFGKNWDALVDCLSDLDEWIPSSGYVVIFDNIDNLVENAHEEFQTFLEIINGITSVHWYVQGIPFYLVLAAPKKLLDDIKNDVMLGKLVRVLG